MGLSTACPLLFSHVQSPGKASPLVVTWASISGAGGSAGAAGAAACKDEDMPAVGGFTAFTTALPFPAINSFSAADRAAALLLLAAAPALSSLISFSNWSIRAFRIPISCSTGDSVAAAVVARPVVVSAAAGGSELATEFGCVGLAVCARARHKLAHAA